MCSHCLSVLGCSEAFSCVLIGSEMFLKVLRNSLTSVVFYGVLMGSEMY